MDADEEEWFEPEDAAAWRDWLAARPGRRTGVWLVIRRKDAPVPNLSYEEAVLAALSYGWIDSVQRAVDPHRSRLWVSPRRPGSWWSGLNKRRVQTLLEQGLMRPAGQAAIDRATADGTWTALDEVEAGVVPPDLQEAFARHPGSAEQFAAFPPSTRRGILEWVAQARRPGTRLDRVTRTAQAAARGERVLG